MKSKIILRDYQGPIVAEALRHREGLIVMSTGSGKTFVGLEIIARLGVTALILVPNTVLQDQWVDACREGLGYEPGVINGKTKDIRGITVSTFASLTNNAELCSRLAQNTSLLLCDESHSCVTDKRIEVMNRMNPMYLYGVTATPAREDGKAPAVNFLFGKTIVDFQLAQLSPVVEIHQSQVLIRVDEYADMIEEMVENESRNTLVAGLATGETLTGRKLLVLTKRRAHARELARLIPGATLIDSDDKDRNARLLRMKNGEEDFTCLVGTTSLLAVGMDIPCLDTLVLACDMKGHVITTQAIGRVLRLFEGKADPKIIDIHDGYDWRLPRGRGITNIILHRQFQHRKKLYESKGWDIVT